MNTKTIILTSIIGVVILYLLVFANVVSDPPSPIPPYTPSHENSNSHTNQYTNTFTNSNSSSNHRVRSPRIDLISPTTQDNDTTSNWNDDDGNLRYVTLLYKPTIDDLQALRRLVGSIHSFEYETIRTTVFGFEVNEDFYEEVRTYSYLRYITLHPSESGTTEEQVSEFAKQNSAKLYSKYIFVPLSYKLQLKAYNLSKIIHDHKGAGPITISLDIGGNIHGDAGSGLEIKGDDYFSPEVDADTGPCSLFRNVSSNFRSKFVYAHDNENFTKREKTVKKEDRHHPDDRLVCLSIATYAGSNPIDSVDQFSLLQHVLPSFVQTTSDIDTPESRYRFAMYLGVQRDPFYDNPTNMQAIIKKLQEATSDRTFSLRIFYTPLNAPALGILCSNHLDITFKWNAIIDQSYRDGCDYIYHDDTVFVTPWVDEFIRYLEAESNFGIVGATDQLHRDVMTLSFSHRNHISIIGSYWPTHLKNWWSDNWAQEVYGKRYTLHSSQIEIRNTQQQGQRYPACGEHGHLMLKLMAEESRPKILAWLKKQPQTYDIRQKINYFEVQNAQGDRK